MNKLLLTILFILLFTFRAKTQIFIELCSKENQLYVELIERLDKLIEEKSENYETITRCISIRPVSSSNDLNKEGFYTYREMEIHSKSMLFFQNDNGRRKYLDKYDFKSYLHFVIKNSKKVNVTDKERCSLIQNLLNQWMNNNFIK